MSSTKSVAGALLFFSALTQSALGYSAALAQTHPYFPNTSIGPEYTSKVAEEPPSISQPTAAPTAIPTPVPTPKPTPKPTLKPILVSTPKAVYKPVQTSRPVSVPQYSGTHEDIMRSAGIAPSDFFYVEYIIERESGWRANARNGAEGACGLVQALPCSKLGPNWQDPVNALKWANRYVSRYAGWAGAYAHWVKYSWY